YTSSPYSNVCTPNIDYSESIRDNVHLDNIEKREETGNEVDRYTDQVVLAMQFAIAAGAHVHAVTLPAYEYVLTAHIRTQMLH
ncbi:hypothetical protein H0H93_009753, partial [Arthromyces matolae]